jgi:DNA-binding beta-propeller fold protein YncE
MRVCVLVALSSLLLSAGYPRASPVLRLVADIPLPGPAVRFDYQSVDTMANRLYISHMNAGELIVFNLISRSVEGTVGDLPKVTGVLAVPALGKIYVSVPGEHYVAVIDARTLRVQARLGEIGFPDGIAYAPDEKKLYVSDEAGGGELVIDCGSDRALTTIPIGGEAGNTVYDPGAKRILVAVQTRNEVVEIDPYTDRVTARHKWAGAAHPHGMAVDAVHRLLFVANERDASLLTVDLRSMKVLGRHRVGGDPDVLAFDPGLGRLYVASESGVVSVLTERDGGLVHDGNMVMAHAHTIAVDPRTHLVYLPLSDVDGHPILRIMRAHESPNN